MPKCEVCNLDYYQECECIACPCCDEQTKYEDFIKGECKWCFAHPKLEVANA
jgi:hypothetical protein